MARFRRSFKRGFRRSKPNWSWEFDSFDNIGGLNTGAIAAGTGTNNVSVASNAFLGLNRDVILAGHYLNGNVAFDFTAGASPADRDAVLSLCIGLGTGENQASSNALFANTALLSGGLFDPLAMRNNRYFLICCVDIPFSWFRQTAAALGPVAAWQTARGWFVLYNQGNVSGWSLSFHCHAKSRRRLEGSSPTLPFIAMGIAIRPSETNLNDSTIAANLQSWDWRMVTRYPRGA